MKSTFYFIVEVLDDYNNYVTLENGLEVMVNNSIETVEAINRVGKVLSAPKGTKAKEGDMILFHHNICRKAHGYGTVDISPFQITRNTYYVPVTEIFMIKTDTEWKAIDPFVFIEPIEPEMITLPNGMQISENEYKGVDEHIGKVAFVNDFLKQQGVVEGDIIAFEEDSQYEYEIEGNIYYKMNTRDILAIY